MVLYRTHIDDTKYFIHIRIIQHRHTIVVSNFLAGHIFLRLRYIIILYYGMTYSSYAEFSFLRTANKAHRRLGSSYTDETFFSTFSDNAEFNISYTLCSSCAENTILVVFSVCIHHVFSFKRTYLI